MPYIDETMESGHYLQPFIAAAILRSDEHKYRLRELSLPSGRHKGVFSVHDDPIWMSF
jgi:hypothetical protein